MLYITKTEKKRYENHPLYQKLTTRCQKIGKSVSNHFWKLLINFGDQLSMGTNCLGDHLSMGTKCLGTVCPGGPIVLGTICPWGPNFWGPIVQGDQLSWGPNEPGLFVLGDQSWGTKCPGTECVWDQMRSSLISGLFCRSEFWQLLGNQLSYFQNSYFFKTLWSFHGPYNQGKCR